MKKIIGFVFSIYAFSIFILMMFLILPFVIIASFFGKVKGGNFMYKLCRIWADVVLFCWGIKHTNIFEAPKAKNHAVIFVFNHISYIDIPFLMKAFRNQNIRVLGKAEMAKVPIFGYIYRKVTVMVDRKTEEGRLKSVQEMKKVLAKNIAIVLAPEGTFNMTNKPLKEFYNGAFKIALETNTAIQPVLLMDGYDRMNYSSIFSITPGKSRAIFLPEILPNTNLESLKQAVYNSMEDGLVRHNASWIK